VGGAPQGGPLADRLRRGLAGSGTGDVGRPRALAGAPGDRVDRRLRHRHLRGSHHRAPNAVRGGRRLLRGTSPATDTTLPFRPRDQE
jgi:hypothetical protein